MSDFLESYSYLKKNERRPKTYADLRKTRRQYLEKLEKKSIVESRLNEMDTDPRDDTTASGPYKKLLDEYNGLLAEREDLEKQIKRLETKIKNRTKGMPPLKSIGTMKNKKENY